MSNFPNPDKVINNLQVALDNLKDKTKIDKNNLTDVINAIPIISQVDRAQTKLGSKVENNKLVFTATNNQTTGHVVADSSKNNATATVSLSVNGKTVTASDGVNSIRESVATVSRAPISQNTVSNDNNDTLTITSTSTQGTGYVTSGTESATTIVTLNVDTPVLNKSTGEVIAISSMEDNSTPKKKVEKASSKLNLGLSTLTKSGPTVTSTEGYTTGTTVTVNTTNRAETNLTSMVTNNTLQFTASNIQDTGYVEQAETGKDVKIETVTISKDGPTVTAAHGNNKISMTVDTGALTATGVAVTTTSINPGTLTVTTATAGNPIAQAGTPTTIQPNSGNYISLNANIAPADTTAITFNGTATADIKTNGYVTSSQKATEATGVTAIANVGVNSASATYYVPISEASYSPQLTMTPGSTNINASSFDVALGTAVTTAPNGPYVAVRASGSVSAESVATITSAGYVGVGSSSTSNTISSVDSAVYYPITACSPATSFDGTSDENNLYLTSTCTLGSKGFYQNATLTRTFIVTPRAELEFNEENNAFVSTSRVFWTGDDTENVYDEIFSKSFDAVTLSDNMLKPEYIRKGIKIFGVTGTFGSNAGASLKIRSAVTYPTIDKIKVVYWEYVHGTPTEASIEFVPKNSNNGFSEWVYIDNIVIDTTFEVILYGEKMGQLSIMSKEYVGMEYTEGGTEGTDENGQYYESEIYKLTDTNAELTMYAAS